MSSTRTLRAAIAATTISLVNACGGGGGGSAEPAAPAPASAAAPPATTPPPITTPPVAPAAPAAPVQPAAVANPITRVIVAGDSLADVGTFGFKATVQNAANPAAGYPVFPELVARQLGVAAECSHFTSTNEGLTFATRPGCNNFAVGSATVLNPFPRRGDRAPFSIEYQLETAVGVNGGTWRAGDLLVVDGGGNDAATLADTYRAAQGGNVLDDTLFLAFLGQQLSGSTIDEALSQADGRSVAATLYMRQLARTFWSLVKANLLDRGATRVALVNVPDITATPRYRKIVAEMAAERGAAAAADFQAAVRQWTVTYNTELATMAAGDARVVIVPFFDDFDAENAAPAAFGLTNSSQAACPEDVEIQDCTDAALDAAPPAGMAPGWWATWLYANRFHPSPRGHELLAASVLRAVQAAGWR